MVRHRPAPRPGAAAGSRRRFPRAAAGRALLALTVTAAALAACAPPAPRASARSDGAVAHTGRTRPLVIAPRGASGHRPEHTLAAYELAIDLGADFVEPDLVITRDGVLVARHENEIGGTTDVALRFPERRTRKVIDGDTVTGWFTESFIPAELRTLRARERLPFRDRSFDGRFTIPAFGEVLDLVARKSRETGRVIGVYPETKHPSYFRSLGLPLEEPLVVALARRGLDRRTSPAFVQSFEVGNLERLRGMTRVRLVQLVAARGAPWDLRSVGDTMTYRVMTTPAGLAAIARYADVVGAEKSLVQPVAGDGTLAEPTSLVRDAHRAGLAVHVWTLRREPVFLAPAYGGDARQEWRRYAALGVDGIFGDSPDDGIAALRAEGSRRR
jgi:glycerophosphoryl diester phosphodiesterase